MKFFKKKMVASLALAGAMAMLASPLVSTVEASGLYSVRQGNTIIGAYESREVAIREARKWANSRVIQSGNTVWTFGTNDNVYRVFQGNTNLGAYASRDVAIREARKWAGSRVVQNGSTVWTFGTNDNLYRVVQGSTTIGAYASRDVAIREARKWANSRVTQNGNTVWTFQANTNTNTTGLYSVRQGNTTIGAYASRDVAIREARKWAGSKVIQNGSVVYDYSNDYRNAYHSFIHGGELRRQINAANKYEYIPDSSITGFVYDIDRDGTPELILNVRSKGYSNNFISIYEFRNGQVRRIEGSLEVSGSSSYHSERLHRDRSTGELFIWSQARYTEWYHSYSKSAGRVKAYEKTAGGAVIGVVYQRPGFSPSRLEEVRMQPVKSLRF